MRSRRRASFGSSAGMLAPDSLSTRPCEARQYIRFRWSPVRGRSRTARCRAWRLVSVSEHVVEEALAAQLDAVWKRWNRSRIRRDSSSVCRLKTSRSSRSRSKRRPCSSARSVPQVHRRKLSPSRVQPAHTGPPVRRREGAPRRAFAASGAPQRTQLRSSGRRPRASSARSSSNVRSRASTGAVSSTVLQSREREAEQAARRPRARRPRARADRAARAGSSRARSARGRGAAARRPRSGVACSRRAIAAVRRGARRCTRR